MIDNQDIVAENKERDPFTDYLGLNFSMMDPGWAKSSLKIRKEMVNPVGSVHGGILFSMADITAGMAVLANEIKVVTLDSNIQYLSPAMMSKTTYLHAEATTIKAGKTIHVINVDITDDSMTLIARAQLTFFVLR